MLKLVLGTLLLFHLFFLSDAKSDKIGVFGSTKFCIALQNTLRARHKTCFLRADTGPCRADIIQWYFDAKQGKCYRFFWGGCQGNGNRFETKEDCVNHCWINATSAATHIPYYCDLAFDYGTCFGHYQRWSYDKLYGTCKRHVYSGCGGNQNNFETLAECYANCLTVPNNTFSSNQEFTTCIPLDVPELHRRRRRRRR